MGIGNRTNEYGQLSDKPSEGNFRDDFPTLAQKNAKKREEYLKSID